MRCSNCGSSAFPSKRENWHYTDCGLSGVTLLGVEVHRCPKCGEVEVIIPRLPELHRLLADLIIRKKTALVGEEFRFLRKHLGFSSTDFAGKLGVTLETVSRWESGKHPVDPVADRLVRVLVGTSKPVEHYPEDVFPTTFGRVAKPAQVRVSAPRRANAAWLHAAA